MAYVVMAYIVMAYVGMVNIVVHVRSRSDLRLGRQAHKLASLMQRIGDTIVVL